MEYIILYVMLVKHDVNINFNQNKDTYLHILHHFVDQHLSNSMAMYYKSSLFVCSLLKICNTLKCWV